MEAIRKRVRKCRIFSPLTLPSPGLGRCGREIKGSGYIGIQIEDRLADRQPLATLKEGHSPEGVDLIVCWEHDWPDCPIEVVELRSAIDSLME